MVVDRDASGARCAVCPLGFITPPTHIMHRFDPLRWSGRMQAARMTQRRRTPASAQRALATACSRSPGIRTIPCLLQSCRVSMLLQLETPSSCSWPNQDLVWNRSRRQCITVDDVIQYACPSVCSQTARAATIGTFFCMRGALSMS